MMSDASRHAAFGDAVPTAALDTQGTIRLNQIAWSAVLAGVVVALVTQLLLNMLGVGIGMATLDPATGDNPSASTFSIGAAVWWTVSGIVASLIGGYTAGRLSGRPSRSTSAWHGLTTWALTTLVIFWLLTTAIGSVVGGVYNTVTSAVGGLGQAASQAAPAIASATDPFASIEEAIRSNTGGGATDPAALRDTAVQAMRAALTGDEAQAQAARDRAVQALAQAQNTSPEQARQQVDQYTQQYQSTVESARQQAVEAADTASAAVSQGALFAVVALLLGGIAAWFGGRSGAVEPLSLRDDLRG